MTTLTQNEKSLILILFTSNFNGDKIDLSKNWNEQHLEDENYLLSMVDTKGYAKQLNMEVGTIKGLLGSLVKKDLIGIIEDEDSYGKPMSWLTIDEVNFDKIKEAVAK